MIAVMTVGSIQLACSSGVLTCLGLCPSPTVAWACCWGRAWARVWWLFWDRRWIHAWASFQATPWHGHVIWEGSELAAWIRAANGCLSPSATCTLALHVPGVQLIKLFSFASAYYHIFGGNRLLLYISLDIRLYGLLCIAHQQMILSCPGLGVPWSLPTSAFRLHQHVWAIPLMICTISCILSIQLSRQALHSSGTMAPKHMARSSLLACCLDRWLHATRPRLPLTCQDFQTSFQFEKWLWAA